MDTIVFDMDGVLLDSERLILESWADIGRDYGYGDLTQLCRDCMGTTNDYTFARVRQELGEDFPVDWFRKEISRRFHTYVDTHGTPLRPGAREALHALHAAGFPLALATSTREAYVRQELTEVGLLQYFDTIVCGDALRRSKPAPDIYRMACQRMHTPPQAAWAVEDSYNGIRSAHAAGMQPIMVPDQQLPTPEMEQLCAHILPDLFAVRDFFLSRH